MNKRILFFGALAAAVAFFTLGAVRARSAEAAQAVGDGPVVAVSVEPQRFAVRKVGGELVRTVVFVPAGADPHTYEPKPSQVAELARADLYMSIGLEFEKAWLGRIAGVKPNLRVVAMNAGLEASAPAPGLEHHDGEGLDAEHDADHEADHDGHGPALATEEHEEHAEGEHVGEHDEEAEHAHHHHHHHGMDPHVWTSPAGMRVMAENALKALSEVDPTHAAEYRANCDAFLRELDALDARLHALFADVPERERVFLVFHPAWGHFAHAYGLTQLAIEVEGKEPGPMELSKIIEEAREHGVKAIFVQPQMSRRTAETVARSVGAQVVDADPLAADWDANLLSVAQGFRDAMK